MAQKIDNNELSRKSAKSSVHERQDGRWSQENKLGQETEDCYDVLRAKTPLPRITKVEGLSLVETDLPILEPILNETNNNLNYNGIAPGEMKKISRKKVSDENLADERQPLKVRRTNRTDMEDQTKMDEIDLSEDGDGMTGEESRGNKRKNKPLPPAVEAAAAAFASRNGKEGSTDLNKNTSKDGKDDTNGMGSRLKPKPFHISNTSARADSFEIATKDDVDAGSVYSFYMEKDFRYHFQHPYFRIFVAYFVTFCNFLIYAEDPVAHSRSECNIPVIGNDFSFVCQKYLPNAWSFLKVFLWLLGTLIGLIVGKLFFHTYLFNHLARLKMFHDDKGSWMTMLLSTILFVFILSYIYNAFLLIGGDYTSPYKISAYMGISNNIFMKAAATGTWCGDFFTAWMVTDMMLQERLYPDWARPVRKWWNTNYNRIILFWIVVVLSSFSVIFVIATDYINWDSLNRDFLHSNEISRAFLASFILVLDITIVMQDWDFPHFISAIDIKLPGINTAHIRFQIPKLLKKLEYWQVHISGKWFNYGILFIVILLDLNMWKNQIFYSPFEYGQYVDDEGRIHTVEDEFSLNHANESIFTLDYRNSTINPLTNKTYFEGDTMMNARYNGYSLALKGMAFIPSIAVFLVFFVMIGIYGRRPKPTKENPYGGRLRKRKRRFNARKKWNSLRLWFTGAVPILTRFQTRREEARSGAGDERRDVEEPRDEVDSGLGVAENEGEERRKVGGNKEEGHRKRRDEEGEARTGSDKVGDGRSYQPSDEERRIRREERRRRKQERESVEGDIGGDIS